ncbi:BZ3500_MvSof-1268-A1-R1_Chr3-3g06498 [Microbotryum saponariae]|uniref:Kinesin-like protein n=1 Tax=Microbotryum saponariae TaxID=289078 RepID=A0A2X0M5K4_9BASI|nr:BZ3500_MvSof-1268-A1-R1_Chr3-3g06498 [Microbotryum saponariae]SDA04465.1 BZ3501_MvSof-1269-A2-R1_Chr3-2g06185 [Microbotryum saponariae]
MQNHFVPFTQHAAGAARPQTPAALDAAPRSPFVPVKKHRSITPPATPSSYHRPSKSMTMGFGGSSTGTSAGMHSPLSPSSQINAVPSFVVQASSPTTMASPPRKVLTHQRSMSALASSALVSGAAHHLSAVASGSSSSHPQFANRAPSPEPMRIRARVTAAATPRRKAVLPGTEHVEAPTPRAPTSHGFNRSMTTTPSAPTPVSPNPSVYTTPRPLAARTLMKDSDWIGRNHVVASPIEDLSRGMSGMGLGSARTEPLPRERLSKIQDSVLVCVSLIVRLALLVHRVRPPAAKLALSSEIMDEKAWNVDAARAQLSLKTGGPEYNFDSIVTGSENEGVYAEAGKDLVLAAMEGFDAVIFAYGQTASGKTFTLSGNAANPGIIPQAVSDIFAYIRDHPDQEFLLRASYLEIYNETLKDLLAPETGPLKVRQDEKKRFFVHPLREEVVTGEAQVAALLRRGEKNRHTGQTDFNERSSRSHSVFQMTIESRDQDPYAPSASPLRSKTPNGPRLAPGSNGCVRMSRLSLIDLAGSEQATSQLERRNEGAFINKSLLTLEKVIASLTDGSKIKPHVPYRDSKLTQILQPSLSGDARVAVIATMNPSPMAIEESKSTLRFAQRVKKVTLKAVVNEVMDDKALIHKYRSHIAHLEAQLQAAMSQPSVPNTPSHDNASHSEEEVGGGKVGRVVWSLSHNRYLCDPSTRTQYHKSSARVKGLEVQIEELRSLFVNSGNVEERRRSTEDRASKTDPLTQLLPPRPVSPMKVLHSIDGGESSDSEELCLGERLLEAQDEIASLKDLNSSLKSRISELEQSHLDHVRTSANDSAKDARIAELVKENQELLVVVKNGDDGEGDLKRLEWKMKREMDKRATYAKALEEALKKEQKRVNQFERFILQHLATQADVISGRRRSSIGLVNHAAGRPSVAGMLPIMNESSPLVVAPQEFLDLDELEFSEEGREQIKKSVSMLFVQS